MSRLTRDGTTEPVPRDGILRRERRQGNINFPCSADHEQDLQPYSVDPCCCCSCRLHFINRSDLYPVPSLLTLQGKETNFHGHKLTQNKVQKNDDKISRESPNTCETICNRFLKITSSEKQEAGYGRKSQKGSRAHRSNSEAESQNILYRSINTSKSKKKISPPPLRSRGVFIVGFPPTRPSPLNILEL